MPRSIIYPPVPDRRVFQFLRGRKFGGDLIQRKDTGLTGSVNENTDVDDKKNIHVSATLSSTSPKCWNLAATPFDVPADARLTVTFRLPRGVTSQSDFENRINFVLGLRGESLGGPRQVGVAAQLTGQAGPSTSSQILHRVFVRDNAGLAVPSDVFGVTDILRDAPLGLDQFQYGTSSNSNGTWFPFVNAYTGVLPLKLKLEARGPWVQLYSFDTLILSMFNEKRLTPGFAFAGIEARGTGIGSEPQAVIDEFTVEAL